MIMKRSRARVKRCVKLSPPPSIWAEQRDFYKLEELWDVGCTDVAVDVGGVSFIDSTGLAFLLSACRSAELAPSG